MKTKKINTMSRFAALLLLGGSLCAANAQTGKLHPTGLRELHENIQGIAKATVSSYAAAALPANMDLTALFPAPGDQLKLGSCVAFAVAYADKTYEECLNTYSSPVGYGNIWSPSYVYSQIHVTQDADGGGSYFRDAFSLMVNKGCTTWADMPYNGAEYGWKLQPTASQHANAAKYKALSWVQLPSGSPSAIKSQIASGMAVVIGVPVYPDLDNLSSSNPIYDNANGDRRGYHAICLIGYDDVKAAFKFINSWGTGWGLGGYGWISYGLVSSLNLDAYVMHSLLPVNHSVTIRSDIGLWVCAEGGGGQGVNAKRASAGPWETYTLIDLNGGLLYSGDTVALRTSNGRFLTVSNNAVVATAMSIGSNEKFTLIRKLGAGQVMGRDGIWFRASNNMYWCAENGGGTVVNANRTSPGGWETFRMSLDGASFMINGGRLATISSYNGSTLYSDFANGQKVYANWSGGNTSNQLYILNLTSPGSLLRDGDLIAIQTNTGTVWSADKGGGGALASNRFDIGGWEQFYIHRINGAGLVVSGDYITISTRDNPRFLCAEGGGGQVVNANRASVGPWETFRIVLP
jgi:C1A family cysteine protease